MSGGQRQVVLQCVGSWASEALEMVILLVCSTIGNSSVLLLLVQLQQWARADAVVWMMVSGLGFVWW